jgi:signal transduction histidine kinase
MTDEAEILEVSPAEWSRQEGGLMREAVESEFFPLVSAAHEFKTPLVIMLGYADLLLSGDLGRLSDKQRDVVTEIQESTQRLQRVVQSLLLLHELKGDKDKRGEAARDEATDVNESMKEIFNFWVPAAKLKSIAYEFHPAPGAPRVRIEPLKLQHIVSNLIENGLYYTPTGGQVVVRVTECFWDRRKQKTESLFGLERKVNRKIRNAVCLAVSDTGPGIAPEHHQDIFREFVQLPGACSRGTGLGLAIARRLVEAHRGVIWVESELGKGSKFSVLLSQTC